MWHRRAISDAGERNGRSRPRLYDRKMKSMIAYILAGGRSSRMGADKAFLELAGKPLILRAFEVAREAVPDVKIVGDPENLRPLVR